MSLKEAFQWIAEERIQAAMEEGVFDNLPGMGKPLCLQNSPDEGELHLAHHILRNNHLLPAWLEERHEIENRRVKAHRSLAQAGFDHKAAREEFENEISAINRAIFDYNLKIPAAIFNIPLLDVWQEYEIARHGAGAECMRTNTGYC